MIFLDPDYKVFLTSLENKKAEDNGQTQSEKTDAQLMSQLLSTQSNIIHSTERAKHTPLLDHLRAQYTARAESSALKNARSYLNRNDNAYAAVAASIKGADKGKEKAKGQQKEGSIATGPKAGKSKEGKKKATPLSNAKPESSNGAASNTKQQPSATTKGLKSKEKAKQPKGLNSAKGPSGSKLDGTKLALLTREVNSETNQAIPTGPSADRGGQRGSSRPLRGSGRRGGRGGQGQGRGSASGGSGAVGSAAP